MTAFSTLDSKNKGSPTAREHPVPAATMITPDAQTLKARRKAAMAATFGLLKGKGVFPLDGLEFEREMRKE